MQNPSAYFPACQENKVGGLCHVGGRMPELAHRQAMPNWAKQLWGLIKAIPEGIRLAYDWRQVQVEAQKETIRAREAQIDALGQTLSLTRDYEAMYRQEVDRLRNAYTQAVSDKQNVLTILPRAIETAAHSAAKHAGKYHFARANLVLSLRLRDLFKLRRQADKSVGAVVLFTGDVMFITVQEIRKGCEQLVEMLPTEGEEELVKFRKNLQQMEEWARSEEKRLSEFHALPTKSDKS